MCNYTVAIRFKNPRFKILVISVQEFKSTQCSTDLFYRSNSLIGTHCMPWESVIQNNKWLTTTVQDKVFQYVKPQRLYEQCSIVVVSNAVLLSVPLAYIVIFLNSL